MTLQESDDIQELHALRFNAGVVFCGISLPELQKILDFAKATSEARIPYIKKSVFKIVVSEEKNV